ncbi:DUF2960 domain-containing protein [Thalassotalea ponticola]|uniref:DUF2960 domain-containing protein n=1 Tax=Thalassotalea ponticola TaxID=1523392 RepID=UPI0025B5FBE1|nr:DUF2960 domain-containing protein [Thalassotalea ponticola]MDN3653381.1 DUF2960 domain-containing protein [Thalassotalea ponticola]
MARYVEYTYQGKTKKIPFSYSKHRDIYEAAAAAEGVDITSVLAMEQQLELVSRGQGIMKNFRQKEFARLGFSKVWMIKDE